MLSSHSVIRRFTPPTCTLEIWAKNSPLSRWTNRQVLKDLKFQLSFDDPRLPTEKQVTITGDRDQLEQLEEVVINYVQNFLQQSSITNYLDTSNSTTDQLEVIPSSVNQPYLKPLGLVSHELFFGNLTPQNSSSQIKLSAVQLFDLAIALGEYKREISVLPNSNTTKSKILIPWWGTVAAAAILAVGLTTVGVKVANQSKQTTDSVAKVEESRPTTINPEINEVIPPEIPESEPQSTPQPKLTEPLSSAEKLPPPPPVDLPKPPPDIPDPAKFPLPEPGNIARIPQPSVPTIASQPESEDPKPNNSNNSQAANNQITIQPNSTDQTLSESMGTLPNQNSASQFNPNDLLSSEQVPIDSKDNQPEELESSENLSPRQQQENNTLANSNTNAEKPPSLESPTEDTAIPQIPQVKEIQAYFQTKWQPPKELNQTLEYRLILNSDGSLQRIIPLGKASQIYVDRTNIPLMGESFVSPLSENNHPTIRLLLSPDGEVRTFLEPQ